MCHQHYHHLDGPLQHSIWLLVVFCRSNLLRSAITIPSQSSFIVSCHVDHLALFDSIIILHTHHIFVPDKTSLVHYINSSDTAWRTITNRRGLRTEP
uniref:Uncharacterized protein n=1 Tax=Octopus bimaculoides TaxID=37653 RepID=A0A0L8GN29_OCTBM